MVYGVVQERWFDCVPTRPCTSSCNRFGPAGALQSGGRVHELLLATLLPGMARSPHPLQSLVAGQLAG
jgi:hypothetical protein